MLAVVGYGSLDDLLAAALPVALRDDAPLELPAAVSEAAAAAELRALAARNRRLVSMIGLGYADTHTPPVIRRNVLENPAWYTAYTPYQPEISQGRLEALLNFQTMVADLTGLPTAGASLLDEATAAAEAMTLCPAGECRRLEPVPRRCRLSSADHRGRGDARRAARHRGRRRRPQRRINHRRVLRRARAVPGIVGGGS